MFKNILLPIDQSIEAWETTNKAIAIAKDNKSQLILLSLVQPECHETSKKDSLSSFLNEVQKKVEAASVTYQAITKEGVAAFVICDVADEWNVDVIFLGTKGIYLEKENENTVSRVIELAPCPVLVIP